MLIDIKKIKVADRIRKEFGNIEELANDIKENGLINPPVVTPDHELIAGERRLRACKHLNYQQIEVRVMSVRDYEHKLKIEIGENEHRKEFTFSERMAWARELERLESAKGRERMRDGAKGVENFPQAKSRDIVAEKIGIGSGKQYEKAKFITEHADSFTIAKLDNEEISIHKAYTELQARLKEKDKLLHQETERRKRAEQEAFAVRKSEQLTRKQLEEFEQQEPQIIEKEVVKEVAIESLEHINIINELKDKIAELKDTVDFYKQKADAMSKDVDDIQLEESSMNYVANKNVHNLIAYMDDFLKDAVVSSLMRGSIATASDATKELLDSRIEAFQEFLHDLKIAKTGRKMN
ncbi:MULTISPECIES: ParB N-terminal domain-containing protein [Bacillus cereus group]|uniref:ParB N-terminal domain-containing protein n=3 Tax=Bacillus cereus group TaxID=86661 RepID=A0AAW5L8C8_BACCE|nr:MULTISPECIES: ParB N-terminal domain-containing protein [Bacillus cereus group]MCQ6288749.1 ParB N-terminal domain-containing protein [Bacillus cereus]MCQ6318150.1 ParB N-terminal domain-containing protein [Bacillus cereus]MCQ6328850.1 ParB N-terminal domain-containing protein [Bacillus cereus]MCQ6343639.1 ParB N-terminal domain-containing protein [Bacillus cereus]MCQ6385675.1 ParB N-terminal domain-containing protein [Bacillus cereus]